jgi:hypothetical protein
MTTRREAIGILGSISIGSLLAAPSVGPIALLARARGASSQEDSTPPLAPGAPMSPERLALIAAFGKASDGLDQQF